MDVSRLQLLAIVVTAGLFVLVFELVRQRRLMERYALLWLACALILLGLSVWRDGLEKFADLVGVAYAPSAIFIVALGFILLLLLHFSLVISRRLNVTTTATTRPCGGDVAPAAAIVRASAPR